MAQMKEQIKTPEKQLSDKKIANLSDAQFKTLVIRMLAEMAEYGRKIEEKGKAMQNEIKKTTQGTNSEEKETQFNNLEWKEEINIQPEQNELVKRRDPNQQSGVEGRNKHSNRTEWRNKNTKI